MGWVTAFIFALTIINYVLILMLDRQVEQVRKDLVLLSKEIAKSFEELEKL